MNDIIIKTETYFSKKDRHKYFKKIILLFKEMLSDFREENKPLRILDLGCGPGYFIKYFKNNFDFFYAIDSVDYFDKRLLDKRTFFTKTDALNLPYDNDFFDVIYSFDVIEHIENDKLFLNEVKKKLKPGGMFLLTTPNYSRLPMTLHNIFNLRKWPHLENINMFGLESIHIREYTHHQIKKLFKEINFNKIIYKPLYLGFFPLNIGSFYCPGILKHFAQYHLIYAIN